MEGVVQQLVDDPDYVIMTNSFPSHWLDDMVDYTLRQSRDSNVYDVISSVEVERLVREVQPKSSKDIYLYFYREWDDLAIDISHANGSKIGCISWLSSGVTISMLEFLETRGVTNRLYKPSLSEVVEMVHQFLYRRRA